MTIWTIGHSTRAVGDLLALLAEHRIEVLCDVRRYPGSRRYPQFNRDALSAELAQAEVDYLWLPELGGRRKPDPDSRNTAWRNASFRGYADYMQTPGFKAAADRLMALAAERRVAIMCAEAVWWQCHRGLIADHFKAAGMEVIHIVGPGKADPHPYTSAARFVNGRLSYESGSTQDLLYG